MIMMQQYTATTSDTSVATPDTATVVTIKNSGLVGVKLSINAAASSDNFYTIAAGEILSELSVLGSPALHFKALSLSAVIELIWY